MIEHQRTCAAYAAWRSEVNTKNGRRGYDAVVERGEVDAWKQKIGERVSVAIHADPAEIERRREQAKTTITAWAQSDKGRRSSSETAQKTSTRPEIQRARAKVLKEWRDTHPEEFAAFTMKGAGGYVSKPQVKLFEVCVGIDAGFKHNQQIKNSEFTNKTHRRQIDVLHKEKRIVVEFDGPYHFRSLKSRDLTATQKSDAELNAVLIAAGYTVIRLTYEDYDHRQGGSFSDRAKQVIADAVCGKISGLHRIGAAYAEGQVSQEHR